MRLFCALLLLLLPVASYAADGDFYKPGSFGGTSVYVLCDQVLAGNDCAEFDLQAKFKSNILDNVSFAFLTQSTAAGNCTFTPKGRIVPGGTAIDILGVAAPTVAFEDETSAELWWRYVYGTVTGPCINATVYVKFQRSN